MIDHITFGVSNFERSIEFYDTAFSPLGVKCLITISADGNDGVNLAAYGDSRPWFWLADSDPTNGKLHVALRADSRGQVDAFFKAAIGAGGKDNGGPGVRPHYHPNYYGAFVLDPDGHNIEAVCHMAE